MSSPRVLATLDNRVTLRLSREFAQELSAATGQHELNGPLAERIEALLDQGVEEVPATVEIESLSDCDRLVSDGRLVFVADEPEQELLVDCPELAGEAFYVRAADLSLPLL